MNKQSVTEMIFDLHLKDLLDRTTSNIDPTLQNIVDLIYSDSSYEQGPWIAGGMGRQIAIDETDFSDIDIWFSSAKQFEQLQELLIEKFGDYMYESYNSPNAVTYCVGDHKVQLIRRAYYPSLQSVFDNFDFTCCQVAVMPNLKIVGPGIEDAKNHVLKLNKLDKAGFLARYSKYVSYGYTMDPAEFIKIITTEDLNYEFDGAVFGY